VYAAVLDACVLVPTALCDTLLRLAEDGFFRPLWSQRILREVEDAVLRIRPSVTEQAVRRRTEQMDGAFVDASVEGWEQVAAGLDLPTRTIGTFWLRRSPAEPKLSSPSTSRISRTSSCSHVASRQGILTTSCSTSWTSTRAGRWKC
jgi:hypothetical protein